MGKIQGCENQEASLWGPAGWGRKMLMEISPKKLVLRSLSLCRALTRSRTGPVAPARAQQRRPFGARPLPALQRSKAAASTALRRRANPYVGVCVLAMIMEGFAIKIKRNIEVHIKRIIDCALERGDGFGASADNERRPGLCSMTRSIAVAVAVADSGRRHSRPPGEEVAVVDATRAHRPVILPAPQSLVALDLSVACETRCMSTAVRVYLSATKAGGRTGERHRRSSSFRSS